MRFDTDSDDIGIDNRCSACISHVESDYFEGPLRKSDRVVKGFGGSRTRNVKIGTLKWSWEDGQGVTTTFRIPNSYFVPGGKVRLLSPQHWAQTQQCKNSQFPKYKTCGKCETTPSSQCGEITDNNKCVLFWDNGNSRRTIKLHKGNNVATFPLASGYTKFFAFCCETDMIDETDQDVIALPAGLISDDEGDDDITPESATAATHT